MILIRASWLKFIFWPLWPVAAGYFAWSQYHHGYTDWRVFDLWVFRAFWFAVFVVFVVAAVGAVLR